MRKAIIFDTETTGINDPEIVEAAWLEINELSAMELTVDSRFSQRYKPSKPIELGAMSVHHIMDEDLVNCPPSSAFQLPEGTEYLIGHNIDFDWTAIGKPDVKRICTLALSRSLWPELDSHSQSAMIYFLERDRAREWLRNAHCADHDVINCHVLLIHILKKLDLDKVRTFEDLWLCSEEARVPKVMHFGKHKGTPIKDIPSDYKAWLLKQPDVDQYLIKALTQ
jgi:exodeoxyribonuclease X